MCVMYAYIYICIYICVYIYIERERNFGARPRSSCNLFGLVALSAGQDPAVLPEFAVLTTYAGPAFLWPCQHVLSWPHMQALFSCGPASMCCPDRIGKRDLLANFADQTTLLTTCAGHFAYQAALLTGYTGHFDDQTTFLTRDPGHLSWSEHFT